MTMKIRYYRKLRGLTQEEIARLLNISLNHYYRIEKGKSLPNVVVGLKLAVILNIDPYILWEIKEF